MNPKNTKTGEDACSPAQDQTALHNDSIMILIPNQCSEYAAAIREEHEKARLAATTACEHARNAGDLLSKAKGQLPHGAWSEWVETNFSFSMRTAQVYMKISSNWEQLSNTQSSALLSINDAVKLLAEPKPEPNLDSDDVFGKQDFAIEQDKIYITDWKEGSFAAIEPSQENPGFFYVSGVDPFGTGFVTRRPIRKDAVFYMLRENFIQPGELNWTCGSYSGIPKQHDSLMCAVFPCKDRQNSGKCRHCDATWQSCAPKDRKQAWFEKCNAKAVNA